MRIFKETLRGDGNFVPYKLLSFDRIKEKGERKVERYLNSFKNCAGYLKNSMKFS